MELWLCCWGGRQALLAAWRRCTYRLDLPIDFHRFCCVPSEPCLYSSTSTATSHLARLFSSLPYLLPSNSGIGPSSQGEWIPNLNSREACSVPPSHTLSYHPREKEENNNRIETIAKIGQNCSTSGPSFYFSVVEGWGPRTSS
jgi:hypothetical protein